VSFAELAARVRPHWPLGEHLVGALEDVREMGRSHGMDLGETYILGDSRWSC
jgi:purine nucleosidase